MLIKVIRAGAGVSFGCTGPFKTFQLWWTEKKLQVLNMAANYLFEFQREYAKEELTLYLNLCIILFVFIYLFMYACMC